jgi:hypothetical protein
MADHSTDELLSLKRKREEDEAAAAAAVPVAPAAPVLVIDHWVCCDACEHWRIVSQPVAEGQSWVCTANGRDCNEPEDVAAVPQPVQTFVQPRSTSTVTARPMDVWAGDFVHFCKDYAMESKDRIVSLSTSLDIANKKTVAAVKKFQDDDDDDPFEEFDEGSSSRPCQIQLLPNGGAYVLTVGVDNLSERIRNSPSVPDALAILSKLVAKCPLAEMQGLIKEFGLSDALANVPATSKKPAKLAPVIMALIQKDQEQAKAILATL